MLFINLLNCLNDLDLSILAIHIITLIGIEVENDEIFDIYWAYIFLDRNLEKLDILLYNLL